MGKGDNSGLEYLHQSLWEDAPLPCGDDQLTKSRNRKLIRETSSNECLEHKCVDLSDYRVYLNQILYRAQVPSPLCIFPYNMTGMFQIYMTWKSKKVEAAVLDFGKCQ